MNYKTGNYSALYVSYSSISDFLKCPRLYFLKNLYRNTSTGNRIQLMTPNLAVGQIVHEVLESLSHLPKEKRFIKPPWEKMEKLWSKITGKKGGFHSTDEEQEFYKKAKEMISFIYQNPGPLKNLSVKIKGELPSYVISAKDNIILCGRLDWLEYFEKDKSVHIIDFKTGSLKESSTSLQLPIYQLLAEHCQSHPVSKVSYWYLQYKGKPEEMPLAENRIKETEILKIAQEINLAKKLERFKCPYEGCSYCRPYEKILLEEAEFVATDERKKDIFIVKKPLLTEYESEIL